MERVAINNLKKTEKETILAFAEQDMSVLKTARETSLHRNTIEHRLKRVKEKTGLDPHSFYDLVKLVHSLERVDGGM